MPLFTNDKKMAYDIENHRYVLTDDGFKAYSGYSLREKLDTESKDQDLTVKFFLERASENVYGLLTSMARNERSCLCYLAQPENRQRIYQCLCREASDMMVNNADLSESNKDGKPSCSVGLQNLLEPLYGNYPFWMGFSYGEDY